MQRRGVLCFALSLLVLIAVGCQKKLYYGVGSELIYEPEVKEEEAKAAGEYLQTKGYFSASSRSTVKIDRRKDLSHSPPTFRVTLILKEGAWKDKAIVDDVQTMADEMKRTVFHGEQTILVLANKSGQEQKKVYGLAKP